MQDRYYTASLSKLFKKIYFSEKNKHMGLWVLPLYFDILTIIFEVWNLLIFSQISYDFYKKISNDLATNKSTLC